MNGHPWLIVLTILCLLTLLPFSACAFSFGLEADAKAVSVRAR